MDSSIKITLTIFCTASKSERVFFYHPTNINGNSMQVKAEVVYVYVFHIYNMILI